jgi:uncharacterized protein (TIGR03437 family)
VRLHSLLPLLSSVLALPAGLAAQTTPGSIFVTHNAYIQGPSVIDPAGNVYATVQGGAVRGSNTYGTANPAIATPGAAQTQSGGNFCPSFMGGDSCTSAYIAKTDPSGNVLFATFLGGPTNSYGSAIAVDSSGNVYVAGTTGGGFPATDGAAIANSTTSSTFAAKISADGSKFLYVTYLPATMNSVNGMSVDAEGNAYIAGQTASQTNSPEHAYAVKLSADGSTLLYSVMLAGSNADSANAVTSDAAGDAFPTGWTRSKDFPVTSGVIQPQLAGAENVFVTELGPSGDIVAATFLGGSGVDSGGQILLDSQRNVYVTGATTSPDFPVTSGAFEGTATVLPWQNSESQAFIAKLSPDLSGSVYASYFPGGSAIMAIGSASDLYVAGGYAPPGLPLTASAPLRCFAGTTAFPVVLPQAIGTEFLARFSARGGVLDSTYVEPAGGLLALTPAANGSLFQVGQSVAQITFGGPGWIAPPCLSPATFSAASVNGPLATPGEFLSLFGWGIGPEQGVSAAPGQTSLGGVQVFFDGIPAPVLYAQSQQVNVQAPFEIAGESSTTVTLRYGDTTFGPFPVPTYPADPELFRLQPNVSNQALAENQDGSLNGPSNPAAPGSVVSLWGTGFPAISPACAAGGLNPLEAVNLAPGFVGAMSINGTMETAQYTGGAPGLACGLVQINMQVPATAASGALVVSPRVYFNNGNSYYGTLTNSILYVR